MINPEGIPEIPGDMEALAQDAAKLSLVGPEFSGTGQRVNSTWQQLAGVYQAPEVGQLLAATGPVQTTTASVGEDLATVGRALATYAATVKEIQNQLAALRTQAQTLVNEAKADKDSEGNLEKFGEFVGIGGDDDEYAERSNDLMGKVNAQIAAFAEAQRVCANTINALYGGVQYRADDGDADQEPGEFGFTAEQLNSALEQGQELPWGSSAETDTGIVGGVWDGMKNFAGDLGALIGRDPVTGDWSWGTAGTAWQGLGTFVLAVGVYAIPGGADLDRKFNNGALGNTLVNAGKGIIAYDEWGKGDNARAGGMAGFNILSAIVGTKGAGSALRGVGAGAQTSRIGAISRAGTAMVRSGEFIGRLPTTESLIGRVSQHLPNLRLSGSIPDVNVPHHTDTPPIDTPRADTPRVHTPNPGSIGDTLSRTPDTPTGPPSTSAADVPTPRGADTTPTPSNADAPSAPSGDRTPALVGAHADSPTPAERGSTGSGTDVPPPDRTPQSGSGADGHSTPEQTGTGPPDGPGGDVPDLDGNGAHGTDVGAPDGDRAPDRDSTSQGPDGTSRDPFESLDPETRQRLVDDLVADSNPEFPLTRDNAEAVLRDGPPNTTPQSAGEGGQGADVKFVDDNGDVVLRRENKSISGGYNSFNSELGHAIKKQIDYNGEVWVQVRPGTDVDSWVRRWQGARTDARLGDYTNVDVIFRDANGSPLGRYNLGERLPPQ